MKKASRVTTLIATLVLLAAQFGWAMPSVSAAPPEHPVIHIVRWGENLTRIAAQYGTTVHAIAALNGHQMDGRPLTVNEARERTSGGRGGGGGGGGDAAPPPASPGSP